MRFSLFQIPVVIRASFLLIAAFLGFRYLDAPEVFVSWVAIVFVSILIHELGHAVTARSLGADVSIELNGLGGLTRWGLPRGEQLSPGRRALVAAAGSSVGVVFGALVWLTTRPLVPITGLAGFIVNSLIYVNLVWGLLNWLPIRPLDGGHLFQSLLEKVVPSRAEMVARVVFTLTAGAALVLGVVYREFLIVILAAWLLVGEISAARGGEVEPSEDDGKTAEEEAAETPE